jgi:AGCS family alanine or glycine:cation symporter
MVYLAGEKSVLPYKIVYCALIVVATMGLLKTDAELDNLTGIGTGVMLFANIPIMLLFGGQAMRAYHNYVGRLRAGQMGPDHPKPSLDDVVSGRNLKIKKD